MKRIILYTIVLAGLIFSMYACNEDILDKYPEDAMSDATFFTKASDFKTYVNGLYNNVLSSTANTAAQENGTDNVVGTSPGSNEMQHSTSGVANETNSTWNNRYSYIRQVNYVLNSQDKLDEIDDEAKQYIGEAYFIRAWHYFVLLQTFGGVPYIDQVLETDSEELFKARDSRDFIATKIMDDLDIAIEYMDWKNEGFATAPRLNKESALAMKMRVGLYEGSWEYYHDKENTVFKVDGANGTDFLSAVVEAGDVLIANQGTDIFVGRNGFEYFDLFNKQDYSSIAGAFMYKHYDADLEVASHHSDGLTGWGVGLTKKMMDNILMSDGKPESLSDVTYDYTYQGSLIDAKDPRLDQMIYSPDRGSYTDYVLGLGLTEQADQLSKGKYIALAVYGETGYYSFKGLRDHYYDRWQDNQDHLMLRYAESLLNYAEAKAILGTISQSDVDKTINVIRDRVGMVHLTIADAEAWGLTYDVADGYDPSASVILNEVRRERRVELLFENYRRNDLKRWAIYEDVVNGYKPIGAYAQELIDYWSDEDELLSNGYDESQLAGLKLTLDDNIGVTGEYINSLFKNADFTETGRGYYIDPDRDYLKAIPKTEIDFYETEGGVTLEQNPGWF